MNKSDIGRALQALRKVRAGGPKIKCLCGECRACKVRAARAAKKAASEQPR